MKINIFFWNWSLNRIFKFLWCLSSTLAKFKAYKFSTFMNISTIAAHLRAAALMETQHFFFKVKLESKLSSREFFQKTNNFTTMIPHVDLFSFVFWKKLKTPKRRFEINWPLRKKQTSSYFLEDIELFRPLWTGRWTQRGHFLIPQHESLRVLNLFLLFSAFFPLFGGGTYCPSM